MTPPWVAVAEMALIALVASECGGGRRLLALLQDRKAGRRSPGHTPWRLPMAAERPGSARCPRRQFTDVVSAASDMHLSATVNGAHRREAPARDHGRRRGLLRCRRGRRRLTCFSSTGDPAGPGQASGSATPRPQRCTTTTPLTAGPIRRHRHARRARTRARSTAWAWPAGDYDNDGRPDVLITAVGGAPLIPQ
jgi:hypothetical protein